jgi:hypothetical protein
MPKPSWLAVISTIWKLDPKSVRKMTIRKSDGWVFGALLYNALQINWSLTHWEGDYIGIVIGPLISLIVINLFKW